jgi:hypothetical protein
MAFGKRKVKGRKTGQTTRRLTAARTYAEEPAKKPAGKKAKKKRAKSELTNAQVIREGLKLAVGALVKKAKKAKDKRYVGQLKGINLTTENGKILFIYNTSPRSLVSTKFKRLDKSTKEDVTNALIFLTGDKSERVRNAAVKALGDHKAKDAVVVLEVMAHNTKDVDFRKSIERTLEKIGTKKKALTQSQITGIKSLMKTRLLKGVKKELKDLISPDAKVRYKMVMRFSRSTGHMAVSSVMLEMLKDPDKKIRWQAVNSLKLNMQTLARKPISAQGRVAVRGLLKRSLTALKKLKKDPEATISNEAAQAFKALIRFQ